MSVIFSLTTISLAGYILAFVNQVIISNFLGTDKSLDIYLYALSVVNFCFFFSGPIVEAVVPVFFKNKSVSIKEASKCFSQILNLVIFLSATTVIFLFIYSPLIVGRIESNNISEKIVEYYMVLWPVIPLSALMMLFSGILNALERYLFQNVGKLVASLVGVIYLLLTLKDQGGVAIAYSTVIVLLLHVLIMAYDLVRAGIRYSFSAFLIRDKGFYKVFLVLTFTYIFSAVYFVFEKWGLNKFGAGNVSAYGYAHKLFVIPQQVFVNSIIGVIWTKLLKKNESEGKNESIVEMINVSADAFGMTLIFSIISFLFSKHIIYLLFFRGSFNYKSLEVTSSFFSYLTIALPFATLYAFQSRLLLTLQRSKIIGIAGIFYVSALFIVTYLAVEMEKASIIPLAQFFAYAVISIYAFLMIRSISDVLTIKVFLKKLIPYLVFVLPWGGALYFTSNNLWIENKILLFFVLSSIYLVGGAYFIYDLYKKSKVISLNGAES